MNVHRILVVAVITAHLFGCSAHHGDAKAALRKWNDRVSSELHAGAPKAEVEQFFVRHGLEYSFTAADRTLLAKDQDVEVNGLVSTSIQIVCRLDSSERLEGCTTSTQHTGP